MHPIGHPQQAPVLYTSSVPMQTFTKPQQYPEALIAPMRQDLLRFGVEEAVRASSTPKRRRSWRIGAIRASGYCCGFVNVCMGTLEVYNTGACCGWPIGCITVFGIWMSDGNQLPPAGETACPTHSAKRLIQQG